MKTGFTKIASVVLAVVLVLGILTGCSGGSKEATTTVEITETQTKTVTETVTTTPASNDTQTIVDSLGRSVEIPLDVQRVVSLSVTNTEILSVLGVEDKIVGVCEWVKRGTGYGELVYKMSPELQALPSPGGGPKPVNVEVVLSLEPDVVLVSGVGTDWVEDLENYGIPVVAAKFEDIQTSMDDLRIVAKCVGKEAEAEEIISYLESKLEFINSRVGDVSEDERPGVCYLSTKGDSYSVYGGDCFQDTQMDSAGGENIASGLTLGAHGELTLEQLLLSDPEVIVTHHGTLAEDIISNQNFANVSAVLNKQVYTLPEWGWDFGSLRDIFCIEWLSTVLHPNRFSDIDIDAEANEFYNYLYGIDYSGPYLSATREIVDMTGEAVTVPGQIKSAVAIYPMALQAICAINGQGKLAGAAFSHSVDTYNLLKQMDPEIAEITDLGHPMDVNLESVLALNPDVVFNSATSELNESLEELGIPVVRIYVETPELVMDGVELIGTILDRENEADNFIEYYQDKLSMIENQLSSVTEEEMSNVYSTGWDKLKSAAGDWFQNCIIENAGGISFSRTLPSGGWQTVVFEDLLAWDPEVIICGCETADILDDAAWQSISAVQNNQVFKMPYFLMSWDLPVPESILGTLWTATKLYPETIDVDIISEIEYFYSQFYRYEISQQEINEILGS